MFYPADATELEFFPEVEVARDLADPPFRLDPITVAAVALIAFLGISLFLEGRIKAGDGIMKEVATANQTGEETLEDSAAPAAPVSLDPTSVVSPYDNFTLTQGLHGYSYGHAAIDIAAGKGAPIKSPIHGVVTALYVDEYGNPTIVIENHILQVTMLHGDYVAVVGQEVRQGDVVGTESNQGYTTDMQGNLCTYKECGYHTHLNIFDKRISANVNPLPFISS
jgi:murein DD-endopeptidase MepM/ murein hydrolase activator NlpD